MSLEKLVIGVTDCSKYANYSKWILSYPAEIEVLKLGYDPGNRQDLKRCHAVLLTGGEDVHPRFYGKPEYFEYCYEDDVNEARDQYEWEVLEYAMANKLPLLGICRGLQIANVFFGGTLIPDISTWGKFNHSKLQDGSDRYHEIYVDTSSWLFGLTRLERGVVNSNHHQSADKIGAGLVASAFSPDGVVEAIERVDPRGESFLCLVQWHPERMKDQESGFVSAIRKAFIREAEKLARASVA